MWFGSSSIYVVGLGSLTTGVPTSAPIPVPAEVLQAYVQLNKKEDAEHW